MKQFLRWFKRDKPCHVGYEAIADHERYHLKQGAAMCPKCNRWYLTKPRLSDQYLKEIFGA